MITTKSYRFDGQRWVALGPVGRQEPLWRLVTRSSVVVASGMPVIDDEGTSWILIGTRRETPYGVVRAWVWAVGTISHEVILVGSGR